MSSRKVKTVSGFLSRVHKLLSEREAWTKGAEAKNKKGAICPPRSDAACKWCLIGAYQKVSVDQDRKIGRAAMKFFANVIARRNGKNTKVYDTTETIINFNDNSKTKHQHVLDVLEQAITLSRRKNPFGSKTA